MKSTQLATSVAVALLCALPLAHAGEALIPKQLAGAPNEFAAMRAVDPAESTIHSKSALIPIRLDGAKSAAGHWQGELPVESGQARFLVFSGDESAWQVDLVSPNGEQRSASAFAKSVQTVDFGFAEDRHSAKFHALENAEGVWQLKVSAPAGAGRSGYLLIEGSEDTELASYQAAFNQRVGESIGLLGMLTATDSKAGVLMGDAAGAVLQATLRVTAPDGSVTEYAMTDDGRQNDGAVGDGLYGSAFNASHAGTWLAQVVVRGHDRNGQLILRTAEHVLPVVEVDLALATASASAKGHAQDDGRLSIDVPVLTAKSGRHYRAYAEIWGADEAGMQVPVAWVGGMVQPSAGKLSLGLDPRWLALAGAKSSFELRNLRIEDPDHFVSVLEAKRLPLELPAQNKALAAPSVIDEAMTMGPRPPMVQEKGVGQRLILVHGYCSGGVWPAGQFSTASSFLDANQNRSHDQFARLLQTYGSTWNSFGTVAHSQGGAASLHLYTYYWSGLDNATGARLIQSVGTPYQGTNLSGILAALGNWFGVGCGTNSNLTYSGASSWLAGIPTWARAKVNYYTTAFRSTNWWTNDYCNFATDLVLSDPEDGTTERSNGQLPGAVNRGHVSGQCHTAGMRDPAQYFDASRNSVMNSNAAR